MKTELENQSTEKLPEGWTHPFLKDLIDNRGISYGIVQPGSNDPNGIPVIRVNNISKGRILTQDILRVNKKIEQKYSRTRLHGGEVLLTLVGSLGECSVVPKTMKGWNVARAIAVIPVREEIGGKWVAFALSSSQSQHYIQTRATTTVQATLNLGDLINLPIPLPPKEVRDFIAHILGSLDDKIELNRQMNETLEAMARAIFKSWFVDFDPVRAKAEGRQPAGMDGETAALFPGGFEEVDGKEVPKGWRIIELGEVVEIIKGRSYTTEELQESTTALVTLKSFQRGGGYRQDGLKPFIGKYKSEQVIKPGELVISFTDVTQAAEVIGKPAIVSANPEYQTLVASLDVGIIRPKDDRINIPFLFQLLGNDEYQSYIYGYCSGTTVLHLDKTGIPKFQFACPESAIMKHFLKVSMSIFDKIQINIQQSRTLTQIRDALLPKLISGDIRIKTEGQ